MHIFRFLTRKYQVHVDISRTNTAHQTSDAKCIIVQYFLKFKETDKRRTCIIFYTINIFLNKPKGMGIGMATQLELNSIYACCGTWCV